jgi:hypothetical protein
LEEQYDVGKNGGLCGNNGEEEKNRNIDLNNESFCSVPEKVEEIKNDSVFQQKEKIKTKLLLRRQ